MARRARILRPAPRTKIWIGAGVGETAIVANSSALISLLSIGALLLRPFTILRTRMLVTYASDQSASSEHGFGAYGKIVVTSEAAGSPATVPGLGIAVAPIPAASDVTTIFP